MSTNALIDRLALRTRPEGNPLMHQRWENLLFLHWPVDPELLRLQLPAGLELDTFDSKGWVSITPFAVADLHLTGLPAIPGLSAFNEINVRTYVHYRGMPGIYFFSLDASKMVPALAARLFFSAPYYPASIEFDRLGEQFEFKMTRTGNTEARFNARWDVGIRLRAPDTESLAFFLAERYCFYTVHQQKMYWTRIYHHPWILEEAIVRDHSSSLLRTAGLPEPTAEPIAHFSRSLSVDIWAPTEPI